MAGNHRTEWTAQLHDVDDSSRVAGRFLRHDGTKFVGDADVASATSLAALDAAIDALAAGLAAETSARQAADTTLTTAVAGKATLVHTHTTSQITDLGSWPGSTALVTLGTVTTGTWHGSVLGPAYLGTGTRDGTKYLRDDGTWQTVISGGTPGGSSGQIQVNDAGEFAGADDLTYTLGMLGVPDVLRQAARGDIPQFDIKKGTVSPWSTEVVFGGVGGWGIGFFSGVVAGRATSDAAFAIFSDHLVVNSQLNLNGCQINAGYGLGVGTSPGGGGVANVALRVNTAYVYSYYGASIGGGPSEAADPQSQYPTALTVTEDDPAASVIVMRGSAFRSAPIARVQLKSSTGTYRAAGEIDVAWTNSTDASRLGELVLSSSGYNGDHVGLRVRDTGSAAQVILEGATADSVLYLTAGGVLAQSNRFTYNGSTLKLRVNGANIQEWGDASGTILSGIDNIGRVYAPGDSLGYPTLSFTTNAGDGVGSYFHNLLFFQDYNLSLVITHTLRSFRIPSDYSYSWASSPTNASASDTGFLRDSAGVIRLGIGATNNALIVGAPTNSTVALKVKGATSPSVNLQEWMTSADIWRVAVTPGYALALGDLSSTTQRQQALIAGAWANNTDATRLGELVLSSSGYNGDHVGLRVRDTGSAAEVILEGATAGRAIYLGSSGELIHSSGFLFDGTNLSVPGTGGGTSEHFGAGSTATQVGASAFGQGANATGVNATALGQGASASMNNSVAVGVAASASATAASAFGVLASATGINATAVGQGANAAVVSSTALGTAASVTGGSGGTAVGVLASVTGVNALAAGLSASATALNAVALGTSCSVSGIGSYGLGPSCVVSGGNSVGIGNTATVAHDNSFALGVLATTTATNQLMVGSTFSTGQLNEFATISSTTFTRTIRVLSSTGVDRAAARYSASWSVNTDASRLGELVLSSSGYNGDHVGLRVRDNGSGADLIADSIREAADDTAAAALSPPVPLNAVYRTAAGFLKVRLT